MSKKDAAEALRRIAEQNHVPVSHVRRQIEEAMAEAKASKDPAVRARWKDVPSDSVEAFLDYLLSGMIRQGLS